MNPHSDAKIVDSWRRNAEPWTEAVRGGQIASRERVTNQAIVDAVLQRSPRSMLDVGCGEGWLCRALSADVERVVGVDAIPALVGQAQAAGGGDFRVKTYEALGDGSLSEAFDAVVCNFSLLGDTSVETVFASVPQLLSNTGAFIVQTLHPVAACGDQPYEDGWRDGSWEGFDPSFVDPAPWYFRTLASWVNLFLDRGFRLVDIREPLDPATHQPASIIFVGAVSP
ncbi:class I SAM-dependent DNA methyltransferase [Marinobacter mangrovi]|uniref:class I SAM-dependent DNA methyltransferase n=1 Tax=Marinobacter mangrovi TaxID=2803918 RepID=UPI001933CD5F|nr:class I SAM-dependent methyltransferase [Marinobacter mangrovi]